MQITIWHKMMSRLGANASETSLLLTEPPFPPAPIQEAMNEVRICCLFFTSLLYCTNSVQWLISSPHSSFQVIYEEFGFQSSFRCPNMALAVLGAQHLESEAESSPDPIPPCELMVVVDSGFSFTHVAPFYQGRAIPGAVTRLNIGGKLMTNYLMEIVSYRQLNVMDDFQLMSEVKESVCYVARDFNAELRATKRARRGPGRRRGCEFVLPDYKEVLRGYVRDPNDAGQSDQEAQSLFLDSERFSVPELLFNPSDIGVQQVTEALNPLDFKSLYD
jgi:actin-related protein 6